MIKDNHNNNKMTNSRIQKNIPNKKYSNKEIAMFFFMKVQNDISQNKNNKENKQQILSENEENSIIIWKQFSFIEEEINSNMNNSDITIIKNNNSLI
jgi:hypothetical protein